MVRHPYKKDPTRDPNLENYTDSFVAVEFRNSRDCRTMITNTSVGSMTMLIINPTAPKPCIPHPSDSLRQSFMLQNLATYHTYLHNVVRRCQILYKPSSVLYAFGGGLS